MGLFGKKKDWNVVAVLYQAQGRCTVNGNRAKGADAESVRDGAKRLERTVFWAVFDQKRAFLEGAAGPGAGSVSREFLAKLMRELPTIKTVRDVLTTLEGGQTDKIAKPLSWADDAEPAG
ncbi:MAG: hypothetical protein ACE5KM_01380 [Planctomycetaceae bacterium]